MARTGDRDVRRPEDWFSPVRVDTASMGDITAAFADRDINTTAPLAGGGDLSADLTLSLSGTKAEFNTACSNGDFLFVGDITQYTDEMARDALGVALTAGAGIAITPNDGADTVTIASTITQYSDELARDALGAALVAGTNIIITVNDGADTITIDASGVGYTDEQAQDAIAAAFAAGTHAGITVTYNDGANKFDIASTITQYTDEMAQDAVGNILTDSGTIDFTYNDGAGTISANVIFSGCRLTRATTQSIVAGAGDIEINWDVEAFDTGNFHSRSSTVTITIASPGVITWTGHTLTVGSPVTFTTTGALPTGITAGTLYYVSVVVNANSFQISTTSGGASLNTSGTQSGTHTCNNSSRIIIATTGYAELTLNLGFASAAEQVVGIIEQRNSSGTPIERTLQDTDTTGQDFVSLSTGPIAVTAGDIIVGLCNATTNTRNLNAGSTSGCSFAMKMLG